MFNPNLLKSAMARKGLNQRKLAKKINWSDRKLSSRMKGHILFDVNEADLICDVLGLDNDERAAIFLTSPSQKREETIIS